MKPFLPPLCGAVVSFVIFNLFPVPRYFYYDRVVQSRADENLLTTLIILVEWPAYLATGAICGYLLTRRSSVRKPPEHPGK